MIKSYDRLVPIQSAAFINGVFLLMPIGRARRILVCRRLSV